MRCVVSGGVPGFGLAFVTVVLASFVVDVASAQPSAGFPPSNEASPPPVAPPPPAADPAWAPPPPAEPPPARAADGEPPAAPAQGWLEHSAGAPAPPSAAVALEPGMPAVLPYRPGLPIPPGYHAESRAAGGLVATGVLTLSVSYAAALGLAFSDSFENGTGWLAVPIAGPWGAIGARKFRCNAETVAQARECFDGAYSEATTIAVFAVDGVIQAVGLALTIAGLSSRTHELVRNDAGRLSVSARPRSTGGFDVGVRGAF